MALPLAQADVARLLAEPSAPVRADVATKLASGFENADLSDSELLVAQDILRILAQDVAVAVRCALSYNLRRATRVPHDVAVRLAHDAEDVALPILKDAPVLAEADLIAVIRQGSPRKQVTIARRPDVSEPIADVLITEAPEPAVVALMENASARIGAASLGKALDRFADSEAVKAGMARRDIADDRHGTTGGHDLRPIAGISGRASRSARGARHRHHPANARSRDAQSQPRLGRGGAVRLTAQMHCQGRLTSLLVCGRSAWVRWRFSRQRWRHSPACRSRTHVS
jgi:uncharacterized protein (DUF2336 family)